MALCVVIIHSFSPSRAKGLQSVVQLMGEKDLYDYWSDTYKVHTMDWSREKAANILSKWQAKFSAEVARIVKEKRMDKKYDVNAFSTSHLDSILEEFSEFNLPKMILGYIIMVIYSKTIFYIEYSRSFQLVL